MKQTQENTQSSLNLARSWRPQSFDEVIGQDLSIRMLKNALYLNKLFPVYLFSGQRGCGKTSTARILARAINCENFTSFQKEPSKNPLPCQTCTSCTAMKKMNHPDFIEMDAASHTGVDDVRNVLESATFMPLMGRKKVYLVDEAHMLSKAAFNAFLKLLEEPPEQVLFILATTEAHKLPETVKSRCFHLIFQPIVSDALETYLTHLCKKETINITSQALKLIIQETDGSARDALNLLEKVRFLDEEITADILLKTLGRLSEQKALDLFGHILSQNPSKLLTFLFSLQKDSLSAENLWSAVIQLCRMLMWISYGVTPPEQALFNSHEKLKTLAKKTTINRLQAIMQLMWSQEELFLKTPNKHLFLELILIQCCKQVHFPDLEPFLQTLSEKTITPDQAEEKNLKKKAVTEKRETVTKNSKPESLNSWEVCLQALAQKTDPLLLSIFKSLSYKSFDTQTKKLLLGIKNNNVFFKDKIEETRSIWLPIVQSHFPEADVEFFVSQEEKPSLQKTNAREPKKSLSSQTNSGIDFSDKEKWPKAAMVAEHFSAKIKKSKT